MEYEKIKQLIDDFGNSKLNSIDIDFPDGFKVSMKKDDRQEQNQIIQSVPQNIIANQELEKTTTIAENTEVEGNIVKSPMVGTFYIKPSPTSNPFVEVGKQVNKGDSLCIIEAMKLMNEIESEFSGKILEIYIKDGEAVEYGAPLFKIG